MPIFVSKTPVSLAIVATLSISIVIGCGEGGTRTGSSETVGAGNGRQAASTFYSAIVSGDSATALRMLGAGADLYADSLPQIAREAQLEHMKLVRVADLGHDGFRYWIRGKRRRTDGALILTDGYIDVLVDSSGTRIANWRYRTSVTIKSQALP
jgi:hypothetical protein